MATYEILNPDDSVEYCIDAEDLEVENGLYVFYDSAHKVSAVYPTLKFVSKPGSGAVSGPGETVVTYFHIIRL